MTYNQIKQGILRLLCVSLHNILKYKEPAFNLTFPFHLQEGLCTCTRVDLQPIHPHIPFTQQLLFL